MVTSALPDHDASLALYRQMLTIRRCEEQLAKSYQAGLIPGACHTYVGEEAIATGVCAHLSHDDAVFSTHRGHGHALAKGVPPNQLIAELFGKATGCSQGRGGSMHLFSPEVGIFVSAKWPGRAKLPLSRCLKGDSRLGGSLALPAAANKSASPSSATAPSPMVPSTRGLIWPPTGGCQCSSSAKTTSSPPR